MQLGESSTQETSKPKHRRLCLHTCDLVLYDEEKLTARVNHLSRGGNITEAAFLALLYGNKKLAFDVLCHEGHSEAQRTLSVMVMSKTSGPVEKWLHTAIEAMMKDEPDPFYQSILRIVDDNSWDNVLEDTSLPLRYKIGVALMKMNDKKLTRFIHKQTDMVVARGLQEGVLLTGLGEKAIDLFQNFMNRTEDLQTSVLALSHTAPLHIRDPRFLAWREDYRMLMNSWKMFRERVTFDVQSTKMAITWDGTSLLQPIPRQFTLRCNNCDQALHREKLPSNPEPSANYPRTHPGSIFPDAKSGIACPRCGAHLPRCEICDRWIGVPDPHTRGGEADAAKKDWFADGLSVCFACRHMCHAGHADQWFREHAECPNQDCDCRCRELDGAGMK